VLVLSLPIDDIMPRLLAEVARSRRLVLTAPPGSGKSTRVPPALAGECSGAVLLLQPRRVAARSLAARIASERGWRLGEEVGYQVRFERVGSGRTRLWVMTEGTLTRRLQDDPYLDGVQAVILDEFHERNLNSDLALAWLAELRRTVREDLALVVMSATMDAGPVARFLDGAMVIDAGSRPHAVALRHRAASREVPLGVQVAEAVREALQQDDCGDVLVFLPGVGEIRAAAAELAVGCAAEVLPLHGRLSLEEQERALRPGERQRVILATNVAETSLTIPGVRTVIDSGLARVNRFDPDRGLDTLVTEGISRASADQRAGRAGRTAPGRCLRLWSPAEELRRPAHSDAEIRRVDLAPVVLMLKAWHGDDPRRFPWFEAPAEERIGHAEELLAALGASDGAQSPLTERGRLIARLPVHPRLGRLILDAIDAGSPRLGCSLAALLSGPEVRLPPSGPRRERELSLPSQVDALEDLAALALAEARGFTPGLRSQGLDPFAGREAARVRDELLRSLGPSARVPPQGAGAADEAALVIRLLLAAYPERVARRTVSDGNRGMMAGGVAVEIERSSGLATRSGTPRAELFLAYGVQGLAGRGASTATRVTRAAELDEAAIMAVHAGAIVRREQLAWNDQRQQVDALIGWFYRDLCLRVAKDGSQPDAAAVARVLAAALLPHSAALVAEDAEAALWLSRLRWLASVRADLGLPDIGEEQLRTLVEQCCAGCRSRAEVTAKPKLPWLTAILGREHSRQLDDYAPAELTVPSGSRIRLDYAAADAVRPPVLAVRLQELFGLGATPRLAGGRVAVLLHLLAPNYRVEQVTTDLASFWATTYKQVRKDLRARYPKHSWPEDPLHAPAQAKGRPRQG
jgi:ATP-dependent helicase HrpB